MIMGATMDRRGVTRTATKRSEPAQRAGWTAGSAGVEDLDRRLWPPSIAGARSNSRPVETVSAGAVAAAWPANGPSQSAAQNMPGVETGMQPNRKFGFRDTPREVPPMRLVKLTDELLGGALNDYFDNVLPARHPPGLFRCPRGPIARNALATGETMLFSYRGRIRFVARAGSGRMMNTYLPDAKYPHCFLVNLQTLRRVNASVEEVEARLRDRNCLDKSFRSRGWNIIDDTEEAERIVAALSS